MLVLNITKNSQIADRAIKANGFLARMVGLLGRGELASEEALIIDHCQSIHMLFMRFPIDVIFVGRDNRVVGLSQNIKPFQLSKIFFKSSYAVECPVGVIATSKTTLGDEIALR